MVQLSSLFSHTDGAGCFSTSMLGVIESREKPKCHSLIPKNREESCYNPIIGKRKKLVKLFGKFSRLEKLQIEGLGIILRSYNQSNVMIPK